MPKATVSFGAALDPALLAASTSANAARRGPSAAQELRRSKRSAKSEVQSREEAQATLPSTDQRARPPVTPQRSNVSVGDVTDPICEFDTTTPSDPISAPPTTSSHPLARLLAQETAVQRSEERSRHTHARQETERRTLYGNKRRRMTRESLRSIRSSTSRNAEDAPPPAKTADQALPTDDHADAAAAVTTASGTAKADEQPTSQHTHISVNSSDGVYQTQFSFYRFEEDGDPQRESQHDEIGVQSKDVASAERNETTTSASLPPHDYTQSPGTQGVPATQRGYDADLSASCSSVGYSVDVVAVRNEATPSSSSKSASDHAPLDQLFETHQHDEVGVRVFQPLLRARHASSQSNVASEEGQSLARQRRLAALCDRNALPSHDVRHVRPTIWVGRATMSKYFGPCSLDAFQFRQSPPARDAVQRWAEWMHSQSSDGVTDVATTTPLAPGEALYTYDGTLASIPPFSST